MLENIKRQTKTCRYELAQAVKDTLRKCPDLSFFLDDSLDYAPDRLEEVTDRNAASIFN